VYLLALVSRTRCRYLKKTVNVYSKSVSVDDFRGISITSVVSKVFEHCILDRYGGYLLSSDNQFGFKKKSSCTHAVYTLRSVDYYVNNGSTVNICALDISKAFDKMNHHGLFLQLMQKQIPLNLLCILENWFKLCSTVLLFHESSVLTVVQDRAGYYRRICLHCILTVLLTELGTVGCYLKGLCISVLLYADDILLIAPSVSSVNKLLHICEQELTLLDMAINAKSLHMYEFALVSYTTVAQYEL